MKSIKLIIPIAILLIILPINNKNLFADMMDEDAESYRIKGYEAQEKGDVDAAMVWYQKAIALDPNYAAPHNDLGIIYEVKGWLDRAESEYQKALAIDPNYTKAHTNLALLYERKGELEKAAYHWMRRYKLGQPNDPWTYEARERLEKLGLLDLKEEQERTSPLAVKERGEQTKSRLKPEKKREVRKGLEKDTNKGWTKIDFSRTAKEPKIEDELQASLRLAEERLREERMKVGKVDSEKSLKLETSLSQPRPYPQEEKSLGQSAKMYYSKAQDYYNKGEYVKALDELRKAKQDYPGDKNILALEDTIKNRMKEKRITDHYNEGINRYRQRDYSGARKEFEAILSILPE